MLQKKNIMKLLTRVRENFGDFKKHRNIEFYTPT